MMMMSEKEREMEEEEETLDHFIHEHPLSLIQSVNGSYCMGCYRDFMEEAAYGCKKCGDWKLLHEECAEMAREIWHPLHPQHTLFQKEGGWQKCAFCGWHIVGIGYSCTSSDHKFQIHLRCAAAKGVERVGDIVQTSMMHPSHPKHPLIPLRRRHSFKCDACGEMETDRSYVCTTCQYWIHKRCATLPATANFHHLHHHPLSLAFYLPLEYIKFEYVCDVCRKYLQLNRWVYHCELCGYVAHIKCATKPPLPPTTLIKDKSETSAEGLIRFPMHDVYEEIIKPFVVKEIGGEEKMIVVEDHKYWTPYHHHQLIMSLVVSSDRINNDDDEDEDESELRIICDGCTTPIVSDQKQQTYMMICSSSNNECKYFLHLACFFLPPELPSHPLHHEAEADHKLVLQPCPKLEFRMRCRICSLWTNGLVYSCTKCYFKADIRCASLPNTIQHQAHPHPNHYLHLIPKDRTGLCRGCGSSPRYGMSYKCGSCKFMVCITCALLPASNKHKLEKHPLPLTYDANLNHPDRFCCDACEDVYMMNPKRWMYHCRDCDTSFHPWCFPATSGYYQNIKFGQRYAVGADVHPHPLTFSLLTTKLRCDVCRTRLYGEGPFVEQRGFHCPSCNFFMCLGCSFRRLNDI